MYKRQDIDSLCRDLTGEIVDYSNSLDYDPAYVKEVEDRLDTINHLKLKYGRTIEEILKYRDEKQNYLENLKNYDDEKEKM